MDAARGELHAYRALALQVELVAGEAGQQVTLPYARVPDQHHWEQEVDRIPFISAFDTSIYFGIIELLMTCACVLANQLYVFAS